MIDWILRAWSAPHLQMTALDQLTVVVSTLVALGAVIVLGGLAIVLGDDLCRRARRRQRTARYAAAEARRRG